MPSNTENKSFVGDYPNKKLYYFSDATGCWLVEKKRQVRESTYAMYHQKVRKHINPWLVDIPIEEITESVLNDFIMQQIKTGNVSKNEGLSWKTVSDLRSVLSMILHWLEKHGFPQIGLIRLTTPAQQPMPLEILSKSEQQKLEKVLLERIKPVHLGILLSLYDGLRIGEVCGLQWGDIDFYRLTISVHRTVMRIQEIDENSTKKTKIMITLPKTYNSIRTIPIPNALTNYIKQFKKQDNTFGLTGTTHCMEPRTLTAQYKRILQTAGIDNYKFHALRHTFATRCVEQGIDIKTLSEIMGHSNVTITMSRYVHPTMEHKKSRSIV